MTKTWDKELLEVMIMIIFKLIIKLSKPPMEKDMDLSKNLENSKPSPKTGIWLKLIINLVHLSPWLKMNLWIWVSKNSKFYIWDSKLHPPMKKDIFWDKPLLMKSIGLLKVPLLQLKIKVNVDHVGLSLQLVDSKVLISLKPEN